MHYQPTVEVSAKSHVIFGGSGDDEIYGSSETDYILGGDGNDTLMLGNEALGGGKGDFIDGGKGWDTLDYRFSNSPLKFGLIQEIRYHEEMTDIIKENYVVSDDLGGYRHDVATNVEEIFAPTNPTFVNYINLGFGGESSRITLYAGTNFISGVAEGDFIDGEGGFNIVELPLSPAFWSITRNGNDWVAKEHHGNAHPNIEVDLHGVQALTFQSYDYGLPGAGGFIDETPIALDHYGENNNGGTLWASSTPGAPNLYTFHDANSDNHDVKVEYYGTSPYHGTLTANIQQETTTKPGLGPTGNSIVPIHYNGTVALTYTPYPGAKYWGNEYYAVTISEKDGGYKTTFFISESTGGTLSFASASLEDSLTPATGAVDEPMVAASNGTLSTSGSIAVVDSYASDIETAFHSFVSSSTGKPPVGKFSAEVQQDPNGGQHVVWNYVVDDDAFLRMAEGATIQETYQLWVADQFDVKSAPKNVVVTIAAKASATTQIGVADSSGVVVQGQDPNGLQIASGKILLSDADLKEMHSVSFKQTGGTTDQGYFQVSIAADTAGTGTGEIAWHYFIQNSKIAAEGNATHTFDVAISDGRGGVAHQAVAITSYAFNPNASPVLNAPATLMAQSGAAASETGTFMDANFAAHHSVSVVSLEQPGSDWGQLSTTLLQDSGWPNPGIGSYTLTYAPSPSALDALQDGQTHIEHWQVSLISDNGKSTNQTLTVIVGRPPNQTFVDPSASSVSGLLVADTHQTRAESASGRVSFVDSITTDSHVLTATFLSSDGGISPMGTFSAALTSDTNGSAGAGHADWAYEAANSDLEALADGVVVHEIWQLALDDGHGGTTLQNVTISLSKTVPNTAPVVTMASSDVFAQVAEAAAITGSQAHDQAFGTLAFADPDSGDAPTASVSSFTAAYLDTAGAPVTLTAGQQATVASAFSLAAAASNGRSGTITWTFSPKDADLDFLSRGEQIQVKAVVTLDDGNGHTVDTPISIVVHGLDDAPIVQSFDVSTVAETAAPVAIDLLQSSSDPDRADTLHLGAVPTATSSDGHIVAVDPSDHAVTLDPQQFAYLGRNEQTTVTIHFSASDGQIATPGTATMIVTGTNEAPQITPLAPIRIDQNAGIKDIDLLASATDVDVTDVLSIAPNSISVVASDGHLVQFTQSAGGLQFDPSQFAYLGDGEQVSLAVNYGATDGLASAAGQLAVVVTGTNDAPMASPITAGAVSERGAVQSIDLLQGSSDPDLGTVLSVVPQSVKVTSSDGHAAFGTLDGNTFSINPADYLYLPLGGSTVLTVSYAVTDGITSTRNTASLTVTGTDSAPTATPVNLGNIDQNAPPITIDLLQTATDADGNDTLSVPSLPQVTSSDGHSVMFYVGWAGFYQPWDPEYISPYTQIIISPSQFSYLQANQAVVVTINYDISDGTTTLHNTATMTVLGETDLSSPPVVLTGTTPATGNYSFNGLTNVSSPDQGASYQYAVVAGSVSATSSDGHAIAVGNAAGSSTITMDRAQFGYLGVGDSATVTFQYDVAIVGSTAPAIHASASLVVMGTNDVAPAVTPPVATLTDTSGRDVFSPLTGQLVAVDPDANDGQFWTLYNQSPANSVVVGGMAAAVANPDGHYTIIPSSKAINALKSQTSEGYWLLNNDGVGGSTNGTINVSYMGIDDTPTSPYSTRAEPYLSMAPMGHPLARSKSSIPTLRTPRPGPWSTVPADASLCPRAAL